jgi:hypothetical protein
LSSLEKIILQAYREIGSIVELRTSVYGLCFLLYHFTCELIICGQQSIGIHLLSLGVVWCISMVMHSMDV